MNRSRIRMKLEATHLTEAQRCEIIAKLSQPNVPSKRALGAGVWSQWRCHPEIYENNANWRTTYWWRNLTYRDICWIWKCYRFQRLWSSTVLDIDDQLLWSDVQTEAGHMYDELWWLFETLQQNVNKMTMNVKHKEIMHSQQMTMHDMFKQSYIYIYIYTLIFVQKIAHLTRMRTKRVRT